MISIVNFEKKWNGRYNNKDGAYGPQCFDIVNQWCGDNGWPTIKGMSAVGAITANSRAYTWIPNKPWNSPRTGDIVIMQGPAFSHIAIVESANVLTLRAFGQCWPKPTLVNSRGQVYQVGSPCARVSYNYIRPKILGWLRKK